MPVARSVCERLVERDRLKAQFLPNSQGVRHSSLGRQLAHRQRNCGEPQYDARQCLPDFCRQIESAWGAALQSFRCFSSTDAQRMDPWQNVAMKRAFICITMRQRYAHRWCMRPRDNAFICTISDRLPDAVCCYLSGKGNFRIYQL